MLKRFLIVLSLPLVCALAQVSTTPPRPQAEFEPGQPVEQPLPFSHKAHVALGAKCLDCHAIEEPGDFAGLPEASKCMLCHVSMMTESPHIKQLTEWAAAGKEPSWNRVYQVEEFVYFSHQVHHVEAGVACIECHGQVQEREVLFQERSVQMYACMQCHEKYEAPNDCEVCHDTH
jgi:hypothetical protein